MNSPEEISSNYGRSQRIRPDLPIIGSLLLSCIRVALGDLCKWLKLFSPPERQIIESAPIMSIHRVTSEFMNQAKELLRRLRTSEANMLTDAETRMLRLQLHLIDIKVSNRQHTNTLS
jgi:hypothetical protein